MSTDLIDNMTIKIGSGLALISILGLSLFVNFGNFLVEMYQEFLKSKLLKNIKSFIKGPTNPANSVVAMKPLPI